MWCGNNYSRTNWDFKCFFISLYKVQKPIIETVWVGVLSGKWKADVIDITRGVGNNFIVRKSEVFAKSYESQIKTPRVSDASDTFWFDKFV